MSQESAPDGNFDSLLRQVARLEGQVPGPRLPRPGQIVGQRYEIEQRIGHGGMGAVFRARHVVSHKRVAIKWLLRSTADEQVRKRFLREARATAGVDHPNVVDVYDVGEDGEGGYLVMELLMGESLRARLAHGPLEIPEAIELLIPAMRGVAAVHQAGVIHRDIKPENIFLCQAPDGTPREAKVLDFGISSANSHDTGYSSLTGDGTILGTLAYMSPEQLQSAGEVDARADVYSFGVVLYEVLTGKLPFEATGNVGLALAIVRSPPAALAGLRPEITPALERVVLRALAKAREDRYPTMANLIDALSAAATAPEQLAEHSVGLAPAPGSAHEQRAWRLSSAFGVLVLLSCAAYWLARPSPQNMPPKAERVPVAPAQPSHAAPSPSSLAAPSAPSARLAPTPSAPTPAPLASSAHTSLENRAFKKPKGPAIAESLGDGAAAQAENNAARAAAPRSGKLSVDEL